MLSGKNAVITGCLQGIGKCTVETFARLGANVFACAYNKTEKYEDYLSELSSKYSVSIYPIYFDMRDNASISAAAREIQKHKLPIHALINIAGIAKDAIFHMVTPEQLQETFQINFFSQILFTQYITKLMLRNGGGSVVFTSSITATDGNYGQLAYGASKAALLSATKTISKELGPKGIRVNAVAPGLFKHP
jgi:3-oxoacyl-[acyl-carrier protein] reductase